MKVISMRILIIGIGSFTQGIAQQLMDAGADVVVWLSRDYGHFGPKQVCPSFDQRDFPSPVELAQKYAVDLMVPMSIDWVNQPWSEAFLALSIPVFCPTGAAMQLERDREFAHQLCAQYGIAFPASFVARNRLEAEAVLAEHHQPFVFKNTLCSPTSPIHTIVCETLNDSRSWLDRLDYAEGVFMQEYMGIREGGHIALVSNGEIHPLVSNQEYKRAFDGNMGKITGAPMGGIIEQDPEDKYELCKTLLEPLLPWFKATNFHGPVQVTAMYKNDQWSVIEYNVRLGVTCGPIILHMLANPLDVLWGVANNLTIKPVFKQAKQFGVSLTRAAYGYPYLELCGPEFLVEVDDAIEGCLWWNEVAEDNQGRILAKGHRLFDLNGFGDDLATALNQVYRDMRKIRCSSSYYRTDVGQSLWPPGSD